jgi:hypothetical protein
VGQQTVQIMLDRAPVRRRSAQATEVEHLKFSIAKASHSSTERIAWTDSDEQSLEQQLSAIAVEIIVAGEMQYREHLIWVYEDSVRRREEMRQAEIKRRLDEEKAERERLIRLEAERLKRLTDSAEDLRRAQSIRSLIATVTEEAPKEIDAERIERWRQWALVQADQIDPLKTGRIWDDVNDS